jgi:hypothetical protein
MQPGSPDDDGPASEAPSELVDPTPEASSEPVDPTPEASSEPVGPGRRRAVLGGIGTAVAALLVLAVFTSPIETSTMTPAAFLRLPVEALVAVVLLLVVPARTRRWVAGTLGLLLGVVAIWKILDLGFLSVLQRPFDPALDWTLFDDAESFLSDSIGKPGAIGVAVVAGLLALGLPVLLARAALRLSGPLTRRRTATARTLAALSAVWITCAVLGAQLVPGIPFADRNVSQLARDRALMVRAGILDQDAFAAEASVDAFRGTPAEQLLTGLRGKDVIVAFIESYGRTALESPEIAPQVEPVLEADTATLGTVGFSARSAYLTSSTVGSGSGLAHATLLSGLWIDSNRRWRNLTSSDRFTLSGAFQQAGWRTVGIMPGNTRAWPEGDFYRFDKVWDIRDMGYRGPAFSWATMPDQYALAAFERDEYGKPDRVPLFAQINLVSSHAPWVPIPQQVDWNDVGDGSIFAPMAAEGAAAQDVWSDPARLRHEYGRSIGYSMDSLVSFVQRYGNDNTVLVVLGDHQPLPIVTGDSPNRDVPISIIARDKSVLDRMGGWGWQDGLKPGPDAPVWRMDSFRDRFLTAFGPNGDPAAPGH